MYTYIKKGFTDSGKKLIRANGPRTKGDQGESKLR